MTYYNGFQNKLTSLVYQRIAGNADHFNIKGLAYKYVRYDVDGLVRAIKELYQDMITSPYDNPVKARWMAFGYEQLAAKQIATKLLFKSKTFKRYVRQYKSEL